MNSEEMRIELESFVNRGLQEDWGGWPPKRGDFEGRVGSSPTRNNAESIADCVPARRETIGDSHHRSPTISNPQSPVPNHKGQTRGSRTCPTSEGERLEGFLPSAPARRERAGMTTLILLFAFCILMYTCNGCLLGGVYKA